MTKREFVGSLERTLRGAGVGEAVIAEHVEYYNSYFNDQIELGHTEEEISEQLGDPRLIAKTIAGVKDEEPMSAAQAKEERKYVKVNLWVIYAMIAVIFLFVIRFAAGFIGTLLIWALKVIGPSVAVVIILGFLYKTRK